MGVRVGVESGRVRKFAFSPARWEEETGRRKKKEKKTAPVPTHTAYPCNLVRGNEGLQAGGWDYH